MSFALSYSGGTANEKDLQTQPGASPNPMKKPSDSTDQNTQKIEQLRFRDLVPHTFLGTASDRYAGWIGQIYTEERYEGRIARRTKKVGGKSLTAQDDFSKNIDVIQRKVCRLIIYLGNIS